MTKERVRIETTNLEKENLKENFRKYRNLEMQVVAGRDALDLEVLFQAFMDQIAESESSSHSPNKSVVNIENVDLNNVANSQVSSQNVASHSSSDFTGKLKPVSRKYDAAKAAVARIEYRAHREALEQFVDKAGSEFFDELEEKAEQMANQEAAEAENNSANAAGEAPSAPPADADVSSETEVSAQLQPEPSAPSAEEVAAAQQQVAEQNSPASLKQVQGQLEDQNVTAPKLTMKSTSSAKKDDLQKSFSKKVSCAHTIMIDKATMLYVGKPQQLSITIEAIDQNLGVFLSAIFGLDKPIDRDNVNNIKSHPITGSASSFIYQIEEDSRFLRQISQSNQPLKSFSYES